MIITTYLYFQDSADFCSGAVIQENRPLGPPSAVPEVFRLELMVLDASGEGDRTAALVLRNDTANAVLIMVPSVLNEFGVEGGAPWFCGAVRRVRLVIGCLLPQVIILEALLRPGIKESERKIKCLINFKNIS